MSHEDQGTGFDPGAEGHEKVGRTRRRSIPAKKPSDVPETRPKRPRAEDVAGVGGMIEMRWSGVPMWSCPKCRGTTFKPSEAKVHVCKQVKFADQEGLAD